MSAEGDKYDSAVYDCGRSARTNVLECRVCEDVFVLQGDRVPRLLHCGHSVCHACLMRLPLQENCIQCPFDRQPTPIGNSGVWGLKKNFSLLELLERLQHIPDKSSLANILSSENLEIERKHAVPCDEDEEHIAVLYCTVCGSHLCENCSDLTHSTRTLAKHRRVPLSEKPRERPKCPSHQSHPAEFICLDEDCQVLECNNSRLMCFICKDYGRHSTHKHGLVEVEAAHIRCSVTNALQHVRKLMEDMSNIIHRIDNIVQCLEGDEPSESEDGGGTATAALARERVQAYFQQLRETLRVQEAAALVAIDTHVRERLRSLHQLKEDVSQSLNQVACAALLCKQATQQDDGRVLVAAREIKDALLSIEKQQQQLAELTPEQLNPEASIPITFTRDNRVHIGRKMEMRVVTLGLDGAGKTSILFKLKQNEFRAEIPTIGFNVEKLEYKNLILTVWDVGGQHKLRPLWKHYYVNTQAVVFVIDSSNPERFPEALHELTKLMTEKELKDAAFLILANKQDLPGCETIEGITEQLALLKLCCGRSWNIQACDAQSGSGLHDGLDWLSRQMVASGVIDVS